MKVSSEADHTALAASLSSKKAASFRAAARRDAEERRKKERDLFEKEERIRHEKANIANCGKELFHNMWSATSARFDSNLSERAVIKRCSEALSDRIDRKENPRVLIVTDHFMRLGFYAELFRMVGCHVETTRSLSRGVVMASPLGERPLESNFDLVVVDRPLNVVDSVAAQMLVDFSYSIRIRDAAYRKEKFCTVSNKFVFVLGETDEIAPFVVQTSLENQDTLCVRRPLYFHLKRIRELILPPFVNSQLRLKLYRKDPNFSRIQRLLLKPSDDNTAKQNGNTNASAQPASSSDGNDEKKFITFESLQEENDHLHNVILSHIRTKNRLEEQLKNEKESFREMDERYRYTIQGLQGQLRDKDKDMQELMEVARELREKVHELQVKELQLQAQAQSKRKKSVFAPTTADTAQTAPGDESNETTVNRNATLAAQLDALSAKQEDRDKMRAVMLEAVQGIGKNDVAWQAKLHAVEINSKPCQCDIWFQSPEEQLEMLRAIAPSTQQHAGGGRKAGRPPKKDKPTPPASEGRSSPTASRAVSRQASSRQLSRASSRASSIGSDDDFNGSPQQLHHLLDIGSFTAVEPGSGIDDDITKNLKVENNVLKKQLQFFKMQRGGGFGSMAKMQVAMPSAEQLVQDGTSDVQYLHRKIATLSQRVSQLEAVLASNSSPLLCTPPPQVEDLSQSLNLTMSPPQAALAYTTAIPARSNDDQHRQDVELMNLRETVSRLEYKLHTQDLYRITTTLQKLVYKGAMLRLMKEQASPDGGARGLAPRKKWTKDAGVNTVMEGLGAAAALWDGGGSLFSPKEMEQRIAELGVKVKEANIMFKEAKDQHLQAERRIVEMRQELEKMQSANLEVTDSLKNTKRQLQSTEDGLKASQAKWIDAVKQNDSLLTDLENKEVLITTLKLRPLTIGVGCQTKVTGDISKKAGTASQDPAPSPGGGLIRSIVQQHGQEMTPRGGNKDAAECDALDEDNFQIDLSKFTLSTPTSPNNNFDTTLDRQRQNAVSSDSANLEGTLTGSSQVAAMMMNAPSDDEIHYLVTTRMAALALYSAAQVDGSDVPRKEHETVVNRLKKECSDYCITIKKLNDLRNAQRTENTQLRALYREMKEAKNSLPEVLNQLEATTNELHDERANAAKRERLLRKEFDLLRLKYAHDDDFVSMASLDIESFANHNLKMPLDFANDRSTRYLCRAIEAVLGSARRVLSVVTGAPHKVVNEECQTSLFAEEMEKNVVSRATGAVEIVVGEDMTTGNPPASPTQRAKRRSSVQIIESGGSPSPNPPAASPTSTPSSPSFKDKVTSLLRKKSFGGLAEDKKSQGTGVIKEYLEEEMQTVDLPPLISHAGVFCNIGDEEMADLEEALEKAKTESSGLRADVERLKVELSAAKAAVKALPPVAHRKSNVPPMQRQSVASHTSSTHPATKVSTKAAVAPPSVESAGRKPSAVVSVADSSEVPAGSEASCKEEGAEQHSHNLKEVPSSPLPEEIPLVHRASSTPGGRRTPILHTPMSRSPSSRLQRRKTCEVTDSDAVDLQQSPSGSAFASADYYEVPLVETAELSTQTEDTSTMNIMDLMEWLEQTDEIVALMREIEVKNPDRGSAAPFNIIRETVERRPSLRDPNFIAAMTQRQRDLFAAVRFSLSTLIEEVEAIAIVTPRRPSVFCQRSHSGPFAMESPRKESLDIPRLVLQGVDDSESASLPSGRGAPRSSRVHITAPTDMPLSSRLSLGRGSIARIPRTISCQTDPVSIVGSDPFGRRSLGFNIFDGEFDQNLTTASPLLSASPMRSRSSSAAAPDPRSHSVGVQVDMVGRGGGSARFSSAGVGSSISDVSVEVMTPTNLSIKSSTELPPSITIPTVHNIHSCDVSPQRDAAHIVEISTVPVASLSTREDQEVQTDPDAHVSKLMSGFVAMHQAFQKLCGKLRSPLCLAADKDMPTLTSALCNAPSVKLAVDAASRDTATMELILEKLSVAYRGLKNAGLHGVDFSISVLRLLVDSPGLAGGGEGEQRHLPAGTKKLPPISSLNGTMSSYGLMSNIVVTSGESNIVPLPPVRGVDEMLFSAHQHALGSVTNVSTAMPHRNATGSAEEIFVGRSQRHLAEVDPRQASKLKLMPLKQGTKPKSVAR